MSVRHSSFVIPLQISTDYISKNVQEQSVKHTLSFLTSSLWKR